VSFSVGKVSVGQTFSQMKMLKSHHRSRLGLRGAFLLD